MRDVHLGWSNFCEVSKEIGIVSLLKNLFAALLLRVLRPWITIRIAPIDSSRIGYFAFEPELYLCRKSMGYFPKGTVDFFYHKEPISNNQLQRMWERVIPFCEAGKNIDRVSQLLPGHIHHNIVMTIDPFENTNEILKGSFSHLFFTPEEEKQGYKRLFHMGIKKEDLFICFINRDSLYLNQHLKNENWEFQNYRDSDIKNYLTAAERMTNLGYWAIRLGAVVKAPLSISNPRIIDYAIKYREEFLDIFLVAKCHFLIAQNSGPYVLCSVFRRPVAFVNLCPFLGTNGFFNDHDLFIPKKYWLPKGNRLMSFQEILASGAGNFTRSEQFMQHGIELLENTPEEILEISLEMEKRLTNTWVETQEDRFRQQQLFQLAQKYGYRIPRMGCGYLKENQEWLL